MARQNEADCLVYINAARKHFSPGGSAFLKIFSVFDDIETVLSPMRKEHTVLFGLQINQGFFRLVGCEN